MHDNKFSSADDIQEVSEEEDDFSEDEYKPAAKKSKKKTPPAKKTKKSPATKKSAEKKTPINAPAKKTKADAVPENDSESDNEDFYSSNTKTTNKKITDTLSTGRKKNYINMPYKYFIPFILGYVCLIIIYSGCQNNY